MEAPSKSSAVIDDEVAEVPPIRLEEPNCSRSIVALSPD